MTTLHLPYGQPETYLLTTLNLPYKQAQTYITTTRIPPYGQPTTHIITAQNLRYDTLEWRARPEGVEPHASLPPAPGVAARGFGSGQEPGQGESM